MMKYTVQDIIADVTHMKIGTQNRTEPFFYENCSESNYLSFGLDPWDIKYISFLVNSFVVVFSFSRNERGDGRQLKYGMASALFRTELTCENAAYKLDALVKQTEVRRNSRSFTSMDYSAISLNYPREDHRGPLRV